MNILQVHRCKEFLVLKRIGVKLVLPTLPIEFADGTNCRSHEYCGIAKQDEYYPAPEAIFEVIGISEVAGDGGGGSIIQQQLLLVQVPQLRHCGAIYRPVDRRNIQCPAPPPEGGSHNVRQCSHAA